MSKGTIILLVILGCLLLAVANLALWAALDVFSPDRFGAHVAEGLQSPEAATALAGPIVDQLMVEYPDLPALARAPAVEVVAWLLQRPLFTPVIKETAALASAAMTTSAQDVVGIDLANSISDVGATVVGVISQVDPEAGTNAQAALDAALSASEESGRLAIYEQGRFPRLRTLSNLAPWLALLGGLGAIALFVVAYTRAEDQREVLKYTGVGIMGTALLSFLLFVPLVQNTAQNNIANPTMQAVVGQVVSVLLRGFAIQSLLLFFIGLTVIIVNHATASQQDAPAPASPDKAKQDAPAPASPDKAKQADQAPASPAAPDQQEAANS
jgi:hypothetical protein